jgi:predicted RNA binding protein YcfA (HicA-like mRNA interferase family)/predicted RNase H-like HicB family nuclease
MPRLTGREVVHALGKLGWIVVVHKGSHAQLKHPIRGGRVTVPLHAGETIGPGLLRSIFNHAGSTVDELRAVLRQDEAMRTYTIVVEPEESGGYYVTVPALPGCFTRGRTTDECRDRAVEAIEVHIAGLVADGEPVPEEVGTPQLAVTVAA